MPRCLGAVFEKSDVTFAFLYCNLCLGASE